MEECINIVSLSWSLVSTVISRTGIVNSITQLNLFKYTDTIK